MNLKIFAAKTAGYISCAVKYTAAAAAAPFVRNKSKYANLWLISERGIDARDNGYYLFRHITQNHPEINIAYAIDKNSPDRAGVSCLGRVIDRGSLEHFLALVLSEVKISTHIMGYTPYIDFFVRLDKIGLVKGRKIFLQHGIIKDNLTYLYSDNVNIDLFVCSAEREYDYVRENFGYRDGVVRLLGLCRYDELYKTEKPPEKILLMPTWRYNLTGADEKSFRESNYFKAYSSFLKSERLKDILEKYNYELLFYPHIEMQKFMDCFPSGGRVKKVGFRDCTVQELLINTSILITDFSSVFFDYGYMEKPMIFYQFDEKDFRKQHYGEGYFSYKRDAFGAVVYEEAELLAELERILQNGARMEEKYLKRVNGFFTLRDKNNCERNYSAIKEIADGRLS